VHEALAVIERTYFNGRDSLFLATRAQLQSVTEAARTLAETLRTRVRRGATAPHERRADEPAEAAASAIDLDRVAAAARDGARPTARRLVDTACADSLTYMGEAQRARAFIAPHVGPLEDA
jgi:acetyl-CoA carboxylase alpha subunit